MSNVQFEGYAILHKQLCDNFEKCPSMFACQESSQKYGHPTAIFINEEGKIDINKNNCIGCASCMEKCGLFRIVPSLYKEYEFQREFDNDPRNKMNFMVERFGCDIINKQEYSIRDFQEIEEYISDSQTDKVNILEIVDESFVMCPFQAIEVNYIKDLFSCIGKYRKFIIHASDIETFEKMRTCFGVEQFPVIFLIYKGKVLGEPIVTEFRVRSESQRVEIQVLLQTIFSERLVKGGIIDGVY